MAEHYHDENDLKLMRECASWRDSFQCVARAENMSGERMARY